MAVWPISAAQKNTSRLRPDKNRPSPSEELLVIIGCDAVEGEDVIFKISF
jgi:hypothetical protein